MDQKAILYPLAIGGAGVVIYLLMPKQQPLISQNIPSPAASGVPQYSPQVQSYDLTPPTLPSTPIISLPGNNYGGASGGSGGCGCQSCISDCQTAQSRFVDGHGGCMSSSQSSQINQATASNPQIWSNYQTQLTSALLANPLYGLSPYKYSAGGAPEGWMPSLA